MSGDLVSGESRALRTAPPATPPARPAPSEELFNPENRQRLLRHFVEVQFPAIRDLVARLLEQGHFLLDPAEVSFRVIEKAVVEADEFDPRNAYGDWIRAVACQTLHESVMEEGEGGSPNERLRRAFNRLPLEERRALFLVAVMGHPVEEASRLTGEDPEVLQGNAREGLKRILRAVEAEEDGGETHGGA